MYGQSETVSDAECLHDRDDAEDPVVDQNQNVEDFECFFMSIGIITSRAVSFRVVPCPTFYTTLPRKMQYPPGEKPPAASQLRESVHAFAFPVP